MSCCSCCPYFYKTYYKVICYILDRGYSIVGQALIHKLIMLTLSDALLCDCVICILNNMHISILSYMEYKC